MSSDQCTKLCKMQEFSLIRAYKPEDIHWTQNHNFIVEIPYMVIYERVSTKLRQPSESPYGPAFY